MSASVEIPLHRGERPGLSQVFGWVLAANVFVVVTVAIIVVLIPWFAGHQPKLDGQTLALAGTVGVALMLGYLWFAYRRHQQRALASPQAHLVLDAQLASFRPAAGEAVGCSRDTFKAEPVHAHDKLRGVDYYLGPALEVTIGEHTWVLAHISVVRRWAHDPRAVPHVDWICGSESWGQLVVALQLDEQLVDYREMP